MRAFRAVVSVVAVSAGAVAFAFGVGREGGGGGDAALEPPPPVNSEFAGVLLRAGLGAEALAAAGVSGEEIAALVAGVEGAYSRETLAGFDEAFMAAKRAHDTLRRTVTSGKGTAEDVRDLRAAEATLAQATAARDGYLTALRANAKSRLAAEKATQLELIHAHRGWALPVQYLVKERDERDWVALRDALSAKEISERDEEEAFEESARAILARVDAEAEIAAAKVAFDTRIASVQTAWNTAAE